MTAMPQSPPADFCSNVGTGLPQQRQGRREDGHDGQPNARSAASAVSARPLFLPDCDGPPRERLAVCIGNAAALLDAADAIVRANAGELNPQAVDALCEKLEAQVEKLRRDVVLYRDDLPSTHLGRLVDVKV